jgi:hypothetical protein
MPDQEEWEMIPHKILSDLKDEVQGLKEKLDQPSLRSDMISTILELKTQLKQLQNVIQTALDTIGKEEADPTLKAVTELQTKITNIEQQNAQIAQALVTVADLVENLNKGAMPRPQLRPMPPSSMMAPPRMPPPPNMPPRRMPPPQSRQPPMGLPPPPPPPQFEAPSGGMFKMFKK